MLGNIASIATLILFVIYFIGRFISLIIEKKVIYEKVDIYINENDIQNSYKIVEEYECEHNGEILIITPYERAYNWLTIYECRYNEKNKKIEKTRKLERFNNIRNYTSVKINTVLPCGMPVYLIEFERSDYIKGILVLQSNGKNGIQEETIKYHHTWKSIIYYLFR